MKILNYYIVVVALLTSCGKEAEKETFYINQGYTGPIAIIFDQKNGVPKEYKDNRRIYRIPASGVLYTQFASVDGILNQKFYYTNSSGAIAEELHSLGLPVLEITKYDSSKIYAMVGVDGGFEKGQGDVNYVYFCVGHATESDSLSGEGYKLIQRVREVYPEQVK